MKKILFNLGNRPSVKESRRLAAAALAGILQDTGEIASRKGAGLSQVAIPWRGLSAL